MLLAAAQHHAPRLLRAAAGGATCRGSGGQARSVVQSSQTFVMRWYGASGWGDHHASLHENTLF